MGDCGTDVIIIKTLKWGTSLEKKHVHAFNDSLLSLLYRQTWYLVNVFV